jgi:hypothetical protein
LSGLLSCESSGTSVGDSSGHRSWSPERALLALHRTAAAPQAVTQHIGRLQSNCQDAQVDGVQLESLTATGLACGVPRWFGKPIKQQVASMHDSNSKATQHKQTEVKDGAGGACWMVAHMQQPMFDQV